VVCVEAAADDVDLERWKIYEVLDDAEAAAQPR